jgi:hypothetical protein
MGSIDTSAAQRRHSYGGQFLELKLAWLCVLRLRWFVHISVFRYPLKAVKVMHTVALRTESSIYNPTTSPSVIASAQV